MVFALSGLRDVIVETQATLLDAAIKARVLRFMPSDFSIDSFSGNTKVYPHPALPQTCLFNSLPADRFLAKPADRGQAAQSRRRPRAGIPLG